MNANSYFQFVKTLYLVRHAKSSWDNPTLDDFERPLNKRGERDAPRMAKRLKEKRVVLDLLLCSPAERTLSTARHFAKVLAVPDSLLTTDKKLYHASSETLLTIIRQLKNSANKVMVVGHNPGLTDFANSLLHEHIVNIPTSGMVACTIAVQRWGEVEPGLGKMQFYDYPKNQASH